MKEEVTIVPDPSLRERNIALLGVFLCIFLGALDQTIVATALPRIVQELGGTNLYAWVATSYLLASTVALPVAGRLADMVSPKYILTAAATVFLIGSALSGLSGSMDALIAFRGLQGLGGGAIFAVAATVLGLLFPPRARGRIQGLFGAVFGLASVVGPYLGGVLTDSLSWRWVFYVNMPFGVLALYVLIAHMPELRVPHRQSFDVGGVVSLILWTVPLLLALSWAGSTYAWTSPVILGLFAWSLVMLVVFYYLERRSPAPLFDMSLLRIPTFTWAGLGTLFFGAAFLGSVLFLPFYLVFAKGVSPTSAGLLLTPLTVGTVIGSVLSGQLASRTGRTKPILLVGNVWAAALFFLIYRLLTTTFPMSELALLMVLLGIGIGPGFPLYTLSVQNVVERRRMGVASSGNQFFRQIGSAIGAAVMGALLVATMTTEIPAHLPQNLRHSVSATQFQSGDSLVGKTTMEHQIEARFTRVGHLVAEALAGRQGAYHQLQRDASLPAADQKLLSPGGIPAIVRRDTNLTLSLFRAALAGNRAAAVALLHDSAFPATLHPVVLNPPASPAAQEGLLRAVTARLRRAEPALIRRLEARVIPTVERRLAAAATKTALEIVAAVTDSITVSVRDVFGLAGVLAVLAFAAGLLLPGLELRHQHHPEGEEGSEGQPAAVRDPSARAALLLAVATALRARRALLTDPSPDTKRQAQEALALLRAALASGHDPRPVSQSEGASPVTKGTPGPRTADDTLARFTRLAERLLEEDT